MRIRLITALGLVVAIGVLMAAPAAGADGSLTLAFTEAEEEEAPAEEGDGGVSEGGVVPAVPAEPAAEEGDDQPWTFRYMVPTVLAIGVLGLIGAGLYYAFGIRGRYQVVE